MPTATSLTLYSDERRRETVEDFGSYFSDTLLERVIYIWHASFSLEEKKQEK